MVGAASVSHQTKVDAYCSHSPFVPGMACVQPGEEVLLPNPGWCNYEMALEMLGEKEEEIFVLTNDQVMEKENAMYESYVMTMLTNNESLQLERIHNMLKMFMIEPKYNKTLVELETFLEGMTKREKVIFEAGVYKRKHRIGTAGATLR